jgi:hypothetical protein
VTEQPFVEAVYTIRFKHEQLEFCRYMCLNENPFSLKPESRCNSVNTFIGYGLGNRRIVVVFRREQKSFLSSETSSLALSPTELSVQCERRAHSPGVLCSSREADHFRST